MMLRLALLILGLTTPIHAILPEIVRGGINHIGEENHYYSTATTPSSTPEEREQLMEDRRQEPEEPAHQVNESDPHRPEPRDLTSSQNATGSEKKAAGPGTNGTAEEADTHLDANAILPPAKESDDNECIIAEDCAKGTYCLYQTHRSKCLACKAVDVRCTKDEECCDGELCIWGQCGQNATKGEAGSICQYQSDCSADLCCAFHKALLFPVCSARPIERERCFSPSNHLMELLSWDVDADSPREHCPCAGNLQCQPLGRGSLCLMGQNSSEEDLADTLYSEIDYIV